MKLKHLLIPVIAIAGISAATLSLANTDPKNDAYTVTVQNNSDGKINLCVHNGVIDAAQCADKGDSDSYKYNIGHGASVTFTSGTPTGNQVQIKNLSQNSEIFVYGIAYVGGSWDAEAPMGAGTPFVFPASGGNVNWTN